MSGFSSEDLARLRASDLFDAEWYLREYPDVKALGMDPVEHYLWLGARLGRNPSPRFDARSYLAANLDVAEAGLNPLLHYVQWGREEGRLFPKPIAASLNLVGKSIFWVVNQHDRMTQHYRVHNLSRALEAHGWTNEIVLDSAIRADMVCRSAVVVLCRIAANEQVREFARKFRRAGGILVFDIDDLVFDLDRLHLLHAYSLQDDAGKQTVRKGFALCRKMMEECDIVTVSTQALRAEVEAVGLPARVVPNSISPEVFFSARDRKKDVAQDCVKICYLSGTKTHDKDFLECADALGDILQAFPSCELHIVGHLTVPDSFRSHRIFFHSLMPYNAMLEFLAGMDVNIAPLEADNAFTDCKSELKIFEAALFRIPTIASPTSSFSAVIQHARNGYLADSPEAWRGALVRLVDDVQHRKKIGEEAFRTIVPMYRAEAIASVSNALFSALQEDRAGVLRTPSLGLSDHAISGSVQTRPLVTVVSIIYRKEAEIGFFLESLKRQDFGGKFELILVDDCSPDNTVKVVEEFVRWSRFSASHNSRLNIRILRNATNIGNCGSRNKGIAEASGDVVIIVDADCMLNRSFVRRHYEAYMHGDCDIAIGPKGIETNEQSPLHCLNFYEADFRKAERDARPQDPLNQDSFVNCVTRNFSVRRRFIEERLGGVLFDEQFSYSSHPDSGFGWEDIEMGCRSFKAAARIKYLPDTFSIHVSHPTSEHSGDKPLRSLKNFRRLHQKHPDLHLISRQWTLATEQAITKWASKAGADLSKNEDHKWLKDHLRPFGGAPAVRRHEKRLRILTYRWHCPHQYELYKLNHRFTLVTGAGSSLSESWEWRQRPMPPNARFCNRDAIRLNDFDLAIVHFDENVLHPEVSFNPVIGRNMLPPDWGKTFRWFLQNCSLPMIAVCHGTPQFVGQYNPQYAEADLGQVIEKSREELVRTLSSVTVVCNSHQAAQEWGFKKSRVIWHGFSPSDFPPGKHDKGVLTMADRAMRNRPHYNGWFCFSNVLAQLDGKLKLVHLEPPAPSPNYKPDTQDWAVVKYHNYVRELSSYSIYFNPTVRSPMPRTRGEAMMAGLISVSKDNHDVSMFIKNSVNGFYSNDDAELAKYLLFLDRNEAAREKIRAESIQLARDVFNQDRYLGAWSELLHEVTC